MRKALSVMCATGLSLGLVGAWAQETDRPSAKTIGLYTAIDFGRIEAGEDPRENGFTGYDAAGTALNRTYVNVNYTERLDDRFLVSIGVGGIFWRAFSASSSTVDDKVIKFGPGISNAYMQWFPGENVDVTFGYFPYKYNAAARNLGEYLFRTEAYPTIIYTGGWSWINDAQYTSLGALLTYRSLGGKLRHDVGFFGEYFNAPIYDITPAYIATYKPTGWLTIGGAGALHRFITPTPATKRAITKDYAYRKDFYLPATPATPPYPDRDAGYVTMLEEDLRNFAGNAGLNFDSLLAHPNNAGSTADTVSFDLAAVKLMAFFEVDFNRLLGLDEARMGKFNLYGEVAQLGLKNYPIFYTEMSQRRPVMVGVSIPTYGLLDNLSVEAEYLKNPNIESIASTYDKLDLPPEENFRYFHAYDEDDVKWSVHASRRINDFLTLFAQVANDHMRLKNGFTQPQYIPVTNEKDHWYWLARIQWAL